MRHGFEHFGTGVAFDQFKLDAVLVEGATIEAGEDLTVDGYDVKYASHALRLAYQGLEIAREGRLTLPMPDPERERVLRVKRGEVTTPGHATILLPSHEHGPVRLPDPPGGATDLQGALGAISEEFSRR